MPRLILGHMPFVGESYQGSEKSEEYRRRFSLVESMVELLRCAVEEYGFTAVATMPCEERLSVLFLDALRRVSKLTGVDVGVIPCFRIPLTVGGRAVDDYRRWVTYYHAEKSTSSNLLDKYVSDPILLCREGWREKFPEAVASLKPYDQREIAGLKLDHDALERDMARLEGLRVLLAEPGSEADFLAVTQRIDLLGEVAETLRDRFDCPTVVGVHHAGSTLHVLEKSDVDFAGYVTPVNGLGALMLPSLELAEDAIKSCGKPIIAIKPFAGGRVAPEEALRYVFGEIGAAACMVGVSSREEVNQGVSAALKLLGKSI